MIQVCKVREEVDNDLGQFLDNDLGQLVYLVRILNSKITYFWYATLL